MKKILLLLLAFAVYSCGSVKKKWVNENFAEKAALESLRENNISLNKESEERIMQELYLDFNSIMMEELSKLKITSDENSELSGTLKAEDGKEKTVSFGGNTITANGADISFLWSKKNTSEKEYKKQINEFSEQIEKKEISIKNLELRLDSLQSEVDNLKSVKESKKETTSKEKTRSFWSFWIWIILIAAILVFLVYRYGKKYIPFL